jgi:hypothetical protein
LEVASFEDARFAVAAISDSPMTYQWRKNGVLIAGASGPSLRLSQVEPADEGLYDVLITNTQGAVLSDQARLTVLADSTDSDDDGMPDNYELANRLDPHNPNDAPNDPDGDGASNLDEFFAGTDPHDATSCLKLAKIEVGSDDVLIRFRAAANRSYTVLYRDRLDNGDWQPLATVPPISDTSDETRVVEVVDQEPLRQARYYRLATPALP